MMNFELIRREMQNYQDLQKRLTLKVRELTVDKITSYHVETMGNHNVHFGVYDDRAEAQAAVDEYNLRTVNFLAEEYTRLQKVIIDEANK